MRIRRNRQSSSVQKAPFLGSLTSSTTEECPPAGFSRAGETYSRAALQCRGEDKYGSDRRDKGVALSIVQLSPVIDLNQALVDIQEENGDESPRLKMARGEPERIQRSAFKGVESPVQEESTVSRVCKEDMARSGEQIVTYSVPAACAVKAARSSRHRILPKPGKQTSMTNNAALFSEDDDGIEDDEDDVNCSDELLYVENRCRRRNGRGWRCHERTLVGYSLCEYHLGKSRLRNINKSFERLTRRSTESEDLPSFTNYRRRSKSRKQGKARSMSSMPWI